MKRIFTLSSIMAAVVCAATVPAIAAPGDIPAIRNRQLIVDGRPFLAIGGELHNSSASSPDYMKPIWEKLQAMNVRTVVSTVAWDMVEPREGQFDFSGLDAQIAEAGKRDMRIVLIWFGAYKNASSSYAPSWVRADRSRFPRSEIKPGAKDGWSYAGAMPKPTLSVFSPKLQAADRKAFTAMIAHLKKADPDHRVIMVQVENEVGLLGDSRDRAPIAEAAWKQPVPSALLSHLKANRAKLRPELDAVWKRRGCRTQGTWAEVFGTDWQAEEIFMAWHFAAYVEGLAAAGKAVLPLPMYANAWLGPQAGQPTAGLYPSGGPTARMLDVWQAGAPTLDLLAPDIYVPDAKAVLADYDHRGNVSFVPEAQFRTGNLFWALGHQHSIGFAVFGIEDGRRDGQLAEAYALLNPMHDVITRAQAQNRIAGILIEDGKTTKITMGRYTIQVGDTMAQVRKMLLDAGVQSPPPSPPGPSETEGGLNPMPADSRPFGFIIDEGTNSFLLVGKGFTADFAIHDRLVEVDSVQEGHFEAGHWVSGRSLNGDERLIVVPADRIGMVRMKLLPD